jgi:hypothetical protein
LYICAFAVILFVPLLSVGLCVGCFKNFRGKEFKKIVFPLGGNVEALLQFLACVLA